MPLYSVSVLQMIDPNGIANWSVTHVDWSEEKWHPKTYRAQDISYELLKNITVREKNLRLCLVTVFVFYFQNLVFWNIKKKQFSYIFEIKNMFG